MASVSMAIRDRRLRVDHKTHAVVLNQYPTTVRIRLGFEAIDPIVPAFELCFEGLKTAGEHLELEVDRVSWFDTSCRSGVLLSRRSSFDMASVGGYGSFSRTGAANTGPLFCNFASEGVPCSFRGQ